MSEAGASSGLPASFAPPASSGPPGFSAPSAVSEEPAASAPPTSSPYPRPPSRPASLVQARLARSSFDYAYAADIGPHARPLVRAERPGTRR
ncbi:hypothetical protein AB0D34_25170 [Streptomyces sp. NPDC048420]|uniref:hypothetical protein n=1 Tax=Streptomyces sp. NPDC048420 TaxID=3155755 RepID=UPI003441B74B